MGYKLSSIFILLFVFQLKHFLADYPWQTPYMLKKFLGGTDWIKPLAAHAGVHAGLTFLISIVFVWNLSGPMSLFLPFVLAALDFSIHFVVDRIKASPSMLGRYKALSGKEFATATSEQKQHNTYFWWALGADQMAHHLTHYVIIFILVFMRGV